MPKLAEKIKNKNIFATFIVSLYVQSVCMQVCMYACMHVWMDACMYAFLIFAFLTHVCHGYEFHTHTLSLSLSMSLSRTPITEDNNRVDSLGEAMAQMKHLRGVDV